MLPIYFISFGLGLIFGSFANVCIFRMPKNESVNMPFSYCPQCGKPIRWFHNIPLLSFIGLRGRCHFCKARISWQYPLVELIMALLFVFSAWFFSANLLQALLFDLLIFYFFTISVIDYHHKIIPDELSLSLIAIGLIIAYWNPFLTGDPVPKPLEALLSGLAGGGFMLFFAWVGEKLFKKEALGGGDIKLMAGFGAFLGWSGLLGALSLGSLLGALVGLGLMALKRKKPGDAIPYGPFLCLGAFVTALAPKWWHFLLFP